MSALGSLTMIGRILSFMNTTIDASRVAQDLRAQLEKSQVFEAKSELLNFSYDASFYSHLHAKSPDVAVVARCAEDVSRTVKYAYENDIPVTARGAASGQMGGVIPVHGGIVIAMNAMNSILEIDGPNLQVMTEPGVICSRLQAELAKQKLSFPPDPGSARMCTVGGMASTNAHGMRAMKYGPTSHWVLGLDVVLPTGETITTGSMNSKARQSSSGMELTKIFVGAEGLLGIITKLRLKVMPLPKSRAIVLALFDRLENAGEAVVATFQAGIMPAATEILDQNTLRAVNLYRPGMNLPEVEAMLLFEVDGNHDAVVKDAQDICDAVAHLATETEWADDPKRINTLWEARSVVGAAAGMLRPNSFRAYIGEDICVPSVKVPETLREIADIAKKYELPVATYGHIGGGGIHPALLINPFSEEEIRRVQACANEFHELALRQGGTVTGEHGVGLARAPYMDMEHGPAMGVMKSIKDALDPKGLMNPGKLFPGEIPESARIGAPIPPLGVFGEEDLPADPASIPGIDPG